MAQARAQRGKIPMKDKIEPEKERIGQRPNRPVQHKFTGNKTEWGK